MQQYKVFELEFQGTAPAGNEVAVDLTADFTLAGETTTVRGFYAGNGVYKIRYLPLHTGACSWQVKGIFTVEGSADVQPAAAGDHGPVRAVETHFEYADGTIYRPFGTTVYALAHQPQKLIEETLATLAAAPFNKVRLCVFPKHYAYNVNDPELFPFEKDSDGNWDVTRPCFAFWDHFEDCLRRLGKMGVQCDLILFHPYDCWGFAKLPRAQALVYLDYLVRRFGALPQMWWSLANEYELVDIYEMADWECFAQFMHDHEPYQHLLSCHQIMVPWDFANPNTTHICHQTGDLMRVAGDIQHFNKPLMIDECCYEGNLPENWGNISAREMVNRFWTVCAQGGYCTHGETYQNADGTIWWAMGGRLIGDSPARIRFLRELLESLPGPLVSREKIATDEELLGYQAALRESKPTDPLMKLACRMPLDTLRSFRENFRTLESGCGDAVILQYYARFCTNTAKMKLPEGHTYRIEVIDSWNMTCMTVQTHAEGEITVRLPGREGIAVLATAE